MANPAPPTLEEAVELLREVHSQMNPTVPDCRICAFLAAYDATRDSQVPAPGGAQGGGEGDP